MASSAPHKKTRFRQVDHMPILTAIDAGDSLSVVEPMLSTY
jgi:hypothetical protein